MPNPDDQRKSGGGTCNRSVIILERHPDVALTLARHCQRLGWQAVVVGSPEELSHALERSHPRALIVGVSLPGTAALQPLHLVAAHDVALPVLCVVEHRTDDPDPAAAFRTSDTPTHVRHAGKPLRQDDLARFLRILE